MEIPLYHHRTDGGAEYLSDAFVVCPDGSREGAFAGARWVIRLDGRPSLMTRDHSSATITDEDDAS